MVQYSRAVKRIDRQFTVLVADLALSNFIDNYIAHSFDGSRPDVLHLATCSLPLVVANRVVLAI